MSAGSQLRAARGARRLSLADVTTATKIQPWVLEALEQDRLQGMMSPIYVRGFLTTYARFLHLAPEPLLAQVRWPAPDPVLEALPPAAPSAPFVFRWPRVPRPIARRLGAALVVAGVIGALLVINPLRRMSRVALPTLALRDAKPAAPPPRSGPAAAPTLASVTSVREPLALPTPSSVSVIPVQPLELSITAHRTTWIKVRADGKLLTQQRLPRGAHERWTAKQQFELIISKPTQVELTLNGQSISPFAVAHNGRVLITHRGVTKLFGED